MQAHLGPITCPSCDWRRVSMPGRLTLVSQPRPLQKRSTQLASLIGASSSTLPTPSILRMDDLVLSMQVCMCSAAAMCEVFDPTTSSASHFMLINCEEMSCRLEYAST